MPKANLWRRQLVSITYKFERKVPARFAGTSGTTAWTQFRQWATARLAEYLVNGFAMDDERLKNPPGPGQSDYFEDLLARIGDIRSSERRFYQKVLDIYDYECRLYTQHGGLPAIFRYRPKQDTLGGAWSYCCRSDSRPGRRHEA